MTACIDLPAMIAAAGSDRPVVRVRQQVGPVSLEAEGYELSPIEISDRDQLHTRTGEADA